MNELEERARVLLHAAADTIEVMPGAPGGVRRRPVWPLVAAACAVAVLLVGLPFLLGSSDDRQRRLEPTDPTTVTVPQTYLMTTEQAVATLEAAGLEVSYGRTGAEGCGVGEDRVVASSPRAGVELDPGETVRIDQPSSSGAGLCATTATDYVDALALLDLARFGENRLAFAPSVRLWSDGEVTETLTDEQARTGEWGEDSALNAFVEAMETPRSFVTTRVFADMNGCVPPDRPERPGGRVSALVVVSDSGARPPDCAWFGVYRDEDGLITDVATVTSG